jgi:hypothetical protein
MLKKQIDFILLLCLTLSGCKSYASTSNKEIPEEIKTTAETQNSYIINANELNFKKEDEHYLLAKKTPLLIQDQKSNIAVEIPKELKAYLQPQSFFLINDNSNLDISQIQFQTYKANSTEYLLFEITPEFIGLKNNNVTILLFKKDAQTMQSLLDEKTTQEEKEETAQKEFLGCINVSFITQEESAALENSEEKKYYKTTYHITSNQLIFEKTENEPYSIRFKKPRIISSKNAQYRILALEIPKELSTSFRPQSFSIVTLNEKNESIYSLPQEIRYIKENDDTEHLDLELTEELNPKGEYATQEPSSCEHHPDEKETHIRFNVVFFHQDAQTMTDLLKQENTDLNEKIAGHFFVELKEDHHHK